MHFYRRPDITCDPELPNGTGIDQGAHNVNRVPYVFGNCAALFGRYKGSLDDPYVPMHQDEGLTEAVRFAVCLLQRGTLIHCTAGVCRVLSR